MNNKLKKYLGILIIMTAVAFVITACGDNSDSSKDTNTASPNPTIAASPQASTAASTDNLKTFTADELKKYDGKNGNPAYVAVEGKVYDVTNVGGWAGGSHNGNEAGKDLTEAIKKSPHGTSKLKGLPVVGKLTE